LLLANSYGVKEQGVPVGLSTIQDVQVLDFWLYLARKVPRLSPVESNVFIVTSIDNHAAYAEWTNQTGVLSPANVVCTGQPSAESSPVLDVSFAVQEARLQGSHVLVGFLTALLDPGFQLSKVVEHHIVRGADTVGTVNPPPGASLSPHVAVALDPTQGSPNQPRVTDVDLEPSGHADGTSVSALAPVFMLKPATVAELIAGGAEVATSTAAALASSAPSSSNSPLAAATRFVGALVKSLLTVGKAVYAKDVEFCFDLSTPKGHAFADGFFEKHGGALVDDGPGQTGSAATALNHVTKTALDLGIVARGDKAMEALLESSSEAKRTYLRYYAMNAGGDDDARRATGSMAGSGELPLRFADVTTRRHNPRKQHPIYATTNNDYGLRKVSQIDMPDSYAGSNGRFTKTFAGGASKISSLNTAITKSKVHKLLDDF